MNRLLITLLTAFDAAIAAAAGIAVVLAPLTLLWVFGLGGQADWAALWPVAATIWQFGHLVPLAITLPDDYLAATGITADAASFTLSLAPLAFAAFTVIFAARSGARSSRADGWVTGVLVGTGSFAALAALIAWTSSTAVATVETWQAVLFPTLLFAIPALAGAIVTEWREAGAGVIARARDRIERQLHGWGEVPGLAVRGAAVVIAGLTAVGALGVAVALVGGGAQIIALFEAGHVDVIGATVTTLAQLAYLPTLIVWALSYVIGPGFAIGPGTVVSPAGTQVGVLPGIPVLGALPGSISPWMLLLALFPVALGAFAGWVVRSRLLQVPAIEPGSTARPGASVPWATAALDGLLAPTAVEPVTASPQAAHEEKDSVDEPIGARLTIAVGIAVIVAGAVALLAWFASGSIGPGTLSAVGPSVGPVALAVGLEVLLGASILLLSPRPRRRRDRRRDQGLTESSWEDAIARSSTDASVITYAERWTSTPYDADHAPAEKDAAAEVDPGVRATDRTTKKSRTNAPKKGRTARKDPGGARKGGDRAADAAAEAAPESVPVPVPEEPPPPLVPRESQPGDAPAPRRPAPLPPVD
ncbi:DUF6350 family protein [Microbacterium sp. P01]|uniref:cell division protein PerM n=1 Tax=Microbacterium sp. P01 TaxID=3366261 RepID=UPI00366A5757